MAESQESSVKEPLNAANNNENQGPNEGQHDVDSQDTEVMEKIMKKLGVMGRYQLIQIIIVCLSSTLFVFVVLNFVFIGYEPDHKCQSVNETDLLIKHGLLSDNTTKVKYGSCEITVTSNVSGEEREVISLGCIEGHHYPGGKDTSFVTEWDLVCEKNSVAGILQALFTLGMGIGVVLFTSLADRWGRKYFYMFDVLGVIVAEVGLAFAPNVYAAIGLRFFTGLFAGGVVLIHCVVAAELVVTKYRQLFWAVDCMWWSCNVMLLACIAYLFRNHSWRYLQLATPILGVPIFLASFALNETPVWYYAKGRYDDTKRILGLACRMNGKDEGLIMDLFQTCLKKAKQKTALQPGDGVINGDVATRDAPPTYTLMDIVRHKYILMIVLISGYTWFTNSLAYYGLYLTSSTLAGDRFLNFFLMGLLEVPSSLIFMPLVVYMGRRLVVVIFMAVTAFSLLVSTCLIAMDTDNVHVAYASTAFFILGKTAVGSSFNLFANYTPELMVTTIRSAGTGVCSAFARLGGIVAPFLLPLFNVLPWAPGALLTFLCLVNLALFPLLPETKGRQLPNTIEDVKQWRKSKDKAKSPLV